MYERKASLPTPAVTARLRGFRRGVGRGRLARGLPPGADRRRGRLGDTRHHRPLLPPPPSCCARSGSFRRQDSRGGVHGSPLSFGTRIQCLLPAEDGSYFFNNLPEGCPCVFSDFDIGWKIFTGFTPEDEEEYGNTPVFLAYKLHTDGRLVNSSYDLTAVHFAVTGETDGMYGLTEALRCEIDAEGNNIFTPGPKGVLLHDQAQIRRGACRYYNALCAKSRRGR